MISYRYSSADIEPEQLQGFFVGWPAPPSPKTHLRLLQQSDEIVLAMDEATSCVVGFCTASTDKVLSAYIPLLEVLPNWQRQGIGSELVKRMLGRLHGLYMIDVTCDPQLQPFYGRFGMKPATGAIVRAYEWQAGAKGLREGS